MIDGKQFIDHITILSGSFSQKIYYYICIAIYHDISWYIRICKDRYTRIWIWIWYEQPGGYIIWIDTGYELSYPYHIMASTNPTSSTDGMEKYRWMRLSIGVRLCGVIVEKWMLVHKLTESGVNWSSARWQWMINAKYTEHAYNICLGGMINGWIWVVKLCCGDT